MEEIELPVDIKNNIRTIENLKSQNKRLREALKAVSRMEDFEEFGHVTTKVKQALAEE